MTMALDIIFFISGSLFLLVLLYLFFLAIVSCWPEKQKKDDFLPTIKFGVIIPAHNESKLIQQTLANISKVDYPQELYEVFVIADNCEDNTAEIARNAGVTCWERRDPTLTGMKGYALKWAFDRLLRQGDHEAYVIIDADTLMDSNFLKAINQRLCEGEKAVQGYYDVLNPERSPMESLSFLGFALNRMLRYKGRTRLGWTANLLGTGMCFRRKVIEQFGWDTTSFVEDIEYQMFLHLNGVRVAFAPEARVYVKMYNTFSSSTGQRRRWDVGKFAVRNKYLPKLLREGIRRRDLSYFDSALELIIPPFSIFVILTLACFFLFIIFDFQGPNLNFYIWISVISFLGMYILSGLMVARASLKMYLSLLYVPYFLLWRLWIVIHGAFRKNRQQW
jgi:cellulose synthase/poly-beta-1,6-N-acetylglucosamine synthase-like glycosyltransferase